MTGPKGQVLYCNHRREVIIIKSISEVYKIIGVTRKTLRGYDEIGLLHPTIKSTTGNQQWLYDDNAINTLVLIQIFVEVGYDRKTIKGLLDSPDFDLVAEYDNLLELLEQKRNHLDYNILLINQMKLAFTLPPYVIPAFSISDFLIMFPERSLRDVITESILLYSNKENDGITDQHLLKITQIWYELFAIGNLKSEDINSEKIKKWFESFSKCIWDLISTDWSPRRIEEYLSARSDEEFGQELSDVCIEIIENQKIFKTLDSYFGPNSSDFVMKVFKNFKAKKSSIKRSSKHGKL